MLINSIGKSSELKLHCFCLFDAYSMPKDIYSEPLPPIFLSFDMFHIYASSLKHGITIKMSLWNNFGSIVSSCNSTVQTISAGRLSKLFQLTRLHSSLSLARVTQSEQLIYVFMSCWLSQLTFTLTLTFCVHSSIMFQVPFK